MKYKAETTTATMSSSVVPVSHFTVETTSSCDYYMKIEPTWDSVGDDIKVEFYDEIDTVLNRIEEWLFP